MGFDAPDSAVIAAEAQRFRSALQRDSRSATLVRLFDYLLEQSAEARAPKEIEIALAVFGKDTSFDPAQDSLVRVQIHRLRSRLESFFARSSGPRLILPKGQYRVILSHPSRAAENGPPLPVAPIARWRRTLLLAMACLFAAAALAWGMIEFGQRRSETPSALAGTPLWASIAAHKQSPLIVAGDSYMFVQSDGREIRHLIMRPAIRSETDLDDYLSGHPKDSSHLHDLDIHYMSVATTLALWPMMSLISALHPDRDGPALLPASRLSTQILAANDVVYVGRLDELGVLRSLIFHGSGLTFDEASDELKDLPSGRIFVPQAGASATTIEGDGQDGAPSFDVDYGYIACLPGGSGTQIVIVAGIRDAAVSQMAKLVADKAQLDRLRRSAGGAAGFEALYQVRSLGGLKFSTRLLVVRPRKADA